MAQILTMHWLALILIIPYLLVLLKIYRGLQALKSFTSTDEPVISVSVVVACRNEEKLLPNLLKDLSSQDYPDNLFEVIVVDDNSTDETFNIAEAYKGISNLRVIKNEGKGKKTAIRNGINSSSGELIITTDADCRMGVRWIRTIAACFSIQQPDMIIGPVRLEDGKGFFASFQELEFLSLQGITAGSASSGNSTMCNGANLSFSREAYNNNSDNLHPEIKSGDDMFLLHSLKQQEGSRIVWLESSDAMVVTAPSPSLRIFLKQRKRWISKGGAFEDRFTIFLGIITFITILLIFSALIASLINHLFINVLLALLLIKSIPDFLILYNTAGRYGRKKLINWFLPVQITYPFYVLGVIVCLLFSPGNPEY
jgi:cellulose synthase/poly-beta-1,6-N-acetylglucosamine synthase-like glycosyltransferase